MCLQVVVVALCVVLLGAAVLLVYLRKFRKTETIIEQVPCTLQVGIGELELHGA